MKKSNPEQKSKLLAGLMMGGGIIVWALSPYDFRWTSVIVKIVSLFLFIFGMINMTGREWDALPTRQKTIQIATMVIIAVFLIGGMILFTLFK